MVWIVWYMDAQAAAGHTIHLIGSHRALTDLI